MEDRGDLEAARDPKPIDPVRRQAIDAARANADLAGGDRKTAADEIEQRGLARTVRADQRMPLARRHVHGDAANDFDWPETLADVAQHDWRRGHVAAPERGSAATTSFHASRTRSV